MLLPNFPESNTNLAPKIHLKGSPLYNDNGLIPVYKSKDDRQRMVLKLQFTKEELQTIIEEGGVIYLTFANGTDLSSIQNSIDFQP